MKAKLRFGSVCILLGIVMIATALALVFWNAEENYRAGKDAEKILQELAPVITHNGEGLQQTPQEKAVDLTDYEMPTMELNGRKYICVLAIPDIDLEMPVQENWDYNGLEISACRYSGAAITRNLVICAHNYNTHFGHLKELEQGSEVYLVTMNGNVLNYKVALVETLEPSAISDMVESPYDLTLFTCTIGGATRVTVRCIMD